MKTIELVKDLQSKEDPIQRVTDARAEVLTNMNVANYVPKSRWKKEVRDVVKRVEKQTAPTTQTVKSGQEKRKHFKKGKPHGNYTGKGQAGQDRQGKQRIQGQDRKTP